MQRLFLLAALTLSSCGGGDTTPRERIGSEGGVLQGPDFRIDVPPGALEATIEIWAERVEVPASYRAAGGTAFRFHPEGTRFGAPIAVRFRVAESEHDATVFWSAARAGETIRALSTTFEGADAVASIDHFSIGFAGWTSEDGGVWSAEDGGIIDGGEVDPGPADADIGDGGELPTGVTCIVRDRSSLPCTTEPPAVTHENVSFFWYSGPDLPSIRSPGDALSSSLEAFSVWANRPRTQIPFFPADADKTEYRIGLAPSGIRRRGSLATVDITAIRSGSECSDVPGGYPLIQIRCTGTTLLREPACYYPAVIDPSDQPPMSCQITRREPMTCTATTTNIETPRFWLEEGYHGPEAVLRTDSSAFVEASGETAVRIAQDDPCPSYGLSFLRLGDHLMTDYAYYASRRTLCSPDGLPLTVVECVGITMLSTSP